MFSKNARIILSSRLIFLFFCISFSVEADSKLTRQSINAMLSDMRDSISRQDADGVVSYFADDAEIIMDLPKEMGGKMEATVVQYASLLKQGWALPATYTYEVTNEKIDIVANGQSATVSDTTNETMQMDGQILAKTSTRETIDVVLNNGKPLIIRFYGKLTLR